MAFLSTIAVETNDRLKYEVAYTKGYYSILKNLENNEVEIAKRVSNSLIEAHMVTLAEFDYLMHSLFWSDTANALCDVAKYKLDKSNMEMDEFVDAVTQFSRKIVDEC